MTTLSVLTFPAKVPQVKQTAVARTNTAGTDRAFLIPKGSQIMCFVLSGAASNAGTTATLSIGTTSGTPVEYVNAVNVLAAGVGNGVNVLSGVAGAVGGKLTADTIVYFKYAETGTVSTLGSWNLYCVYFTNSSYQTGVNQ